MRYPRIGEVGARTTVKRRVTPGVRGLPRTLVLGGYRLARSQKKEQGGWRKIGLRDERGRLQAGNGDHDTLEVMVPGLKMALVGVGAVGWWDDMCMMKWSWLASRIQWRGGDAVEGVRETAL